MSRRKLKVVLEAIQTLQRADKFMTICLYFAIHKPSKIFHSPPVRIGTASLQLLVQDVRVCCGRKALLRF